MQREMKSLNLGSVNGREVSKEASQRLIRKRMCEVVTEISEDLSRTSNFVEENSAPSVQTNTPARLNFTIFIFFYFFTFN